MGEFVDDVIILEPIIAIRRCRSPYVHPTGPRLATTYMVSYQYPYLEKEDTRVV